MAIELPKAITEYYATDQNKTVEDFLQCFTDDAAVQDEAHTYIGHSAIRRWKTGVSQKYAYTVEPLSIAREKDRIVVTSRLVGDFPGSPVDLRYFFVLRGEKIAALEIIP